jgi:hypothetical protein
MRKKNNNNFSSSPKTIRKMSSNRAIMMVMTIRIGKIIISRLNKGEVKMIMERNNKLSNKARRKHKIKRIANRTNSPKRKVETIKISRGIKILAKANNFKKRKLTKPILKRKNKTSIRDKNKMGTSCNYYLHRNNSKVNSSKTRILCKMNRKISYNHQAKANAKNLLSLKTTS